MNENSLSEIRRMIAEEIGNAMNSTRGRGNGGRIGRSRGDGGSNGRGRGRARAFNRESPYGDGLNRAQRRALLREQSNATEQRA